MRQRGVSGHPERKDPYRLLRSKGAFGGVSVSFAEGEGDRAKRAWQEAVGSGEGVLRGARVRVGAVPCHVVVAASLRVGAVLPGWRRSAAGRARVCQRGGVAFASSPGSPAVPPASPGEPTGPAAPGGCRRRRVTGANPKVLRRGGTCQRAEGGRGRQYLANGVQRLLQETSREYRAWWALLCVCIRLE